MEAPRGEGHGVFPPRPAARPLDPPADTWFSFPAPTIWARFIQRPPHLAREATTTQTDSGPVLIACHICDALLSEPPAGAPRTRCPRCGAILTTERPGALDGVLAATLTTVALLGAGVFLPFVNIEAAGRRQYASVFDAVAAAGGEAWPLALAVGAMVVALPLIRALALLWVLVPLRLGRPVLPFARPAFRLAVELRPWSMVEVFLIGVIVALVKMAGLAIVGLGAAFWLFLVLTVVVFCEDAALCRRSIWRRLA